MRCTRRRNGTEQCVESVDSRLCSETPNNRHIARLVEEEASNMRDLRGASSTRYAFKQRILTDIITGGDRR